MKRNYFNKLGLFVAVALGCAVGMPSVQGAPTNDAVCRVLSAQDSVAEFHSLRRKVVEGFNRPEQRACVDLITFGEADYHIKIKSPLVIDNFKDLDCSGQSSVCGDGWGLILDGSPAKSVWLDGSDLAAGQCVLKVRAHGVWVKGLVIRAHRIEDAICDEGEGNVFDVEIETDAPPDTDNDEHPDAMDNCPDTPNPDQKDTDGDSRGDACDDDDDNDGIPDDEEACTDPLKADSDGDGIQDLEDNCPCAANPEQEDWDEDHLGDICDPDLPPDDDPPDEPDPPTEPEDQDGDGVPDEEDNCIDVPNPDQTDTDGDTLGDACDDEDPLEPPPPDDGPGPDSDGDSHPDGLDNCPDTANPDQEDHDADGLGDRCDEDFEMIPGDMDGDGTGNEVDNCDNIANAAQEDADGDGIGDACDTDISLTEPDRWQGLPQEATGCVLRQPLTKSQPWNLATGLLLILIPLLFHLHFRAP